MRDILLPMLVLFTAASPTAAAEAKKMGELIASGFEIKGAAAGLNSLGFALQKGTEAYYCTFVADMMSGRPQRAPDLPDFNCQPMHKP